MKTVKVRIIVAVDSDGDWKSFGDSGVNEENTIQELDMSMYGGYPTSYFWLEAELPVPDKTIPVIQSEVTKV